MVFDERVSGSISVPKSTQNQLKIHQDRSKINFFGQVGSTWVASSVIFALLGSKLWNLRPLRCETRLSRASWERKSRPRAPPSTPKSSKSRPKRPQDRFGSRCRSKSTFDNDFRSMFHRVRYHNRSANRPRISLESFVEVVIGEHGDIAFCLLYTSPSPRDA